MKSFEIGCVRYFYQDLKEYKKGECGDYFKSRVEYSPGYIYPFDSGDFYGNGALVLILSQDQMGAEETFSVGMPVYDKDNKLLGYMGLSPMYNSMTMGMNYENEYINTDDLGNSLQCPHWVVYIIDKRQKEILDIHKLIKVKTYWQVLYEEAEKK